MDVSYINPFIESVYEIFESMFRTEPVRGNIHSTTGCLDSELINATISLEGSVSGIIVLALPVSTSLVLVNKLLSMDIAEVDENVLDGVGELTNIVAGAAKSRLPKEDDVPLKLGIPAVFKNVNEAKPLPDAETWVVIPFDSECGAFSIWVALSSVA